jgi:hypothetical protein
MSALVGPLADSAAGESWNDRAPDRQVVATRSRAPRTLPSLIIGTGRLTQEKK